MTKQIKAFVEANKIVSEQGKWADEAWDEFMEEEALEQPTAEQSSLVQEPVIIKQENGMVLKLGYDELPNGTAFYTTPPSREWVGLSDDEIKDIEYEYAYASIGFARAIEAKLREKNG